MTEIRKEETQQDFFPEHSRESRLADRFPSLPKTHKPILIHTSLEQLLLVGILSILIGCGVFFLGVLRGRALDRMAQGSAVAALKMEAPAAQRTPIQGSAQVVSPASLPGTALPQNTVNSAVMELPNKMVFDGKKPYTIQLVTYKKRNLAEGEVAALKRMGYYAAIITSGEFFVVCGGQYASIDEAKKDLKFFGGKYKGCYLRRR